MKVLLDTNVLSEIRRPAPEPKVLAWLDTIDEDRAFISVASLAELRRGIALMADVKVVVRRVETPVYDDDDDD